MFNIKTNFNVKKRSVLTLLMLAPLSMAGLGISTNVLADDDKVYPGNNCQTKSANFRISDDAPGAIQNVSDRSNLTVSCPIVRDYMSGGSGMKRARVWFHNNNTARAISCRLETRHGNGALVKRVMASTAVGARQGVLVLNNNSDAGVGRSFNLTCTLPPTVETFRFPRIEAYKVEEYD